MYHKNVNDQFLWQKMFSLKAQVCENLQEHTWSYARDSVGKIYWTVVTVARLDQ